MHGERPTFWLQTASGSAYAVGASEVLAGALDFDRDVVVPLSRICRYLGHTKRPWSVAAHAVCCSCFVQHVGGDLVAQRAALHHDDHEALIGDIPAPIKAWLKGRGAGEALKELEQGATDAIARLIGFGGHGRTVTDAVRRADLAMLMGEAKLLMVEPPMEWGIDVHHDDVRLATEIVGRYLVSPREPWGDDAADAYRLREAWLVEAMEGESC
jgi:hypothetical protein